MVVVVAGREVAVCEIEWQTHTIQTSTATMPCTGRGSSAVAAAVACGAMAGARRVVAEVAHGASWWEAWRQVCGAWVAQARCRCPLVALRPGPLWQAEQVEACMGCLWALGLAPMQAAWALLAALATHPVRQGPWHQVHPPPQQPQAALVAPPQVEPHRPPQQSVLPQVVAPCRRPQHHRRRTEQWAAGERQQQQPRQQQEQGSHRCPHKQLQQLQQLLHTPRPRQPTRTHSSNNNSNSSRRSSSKHITVTASQRTADPTRLWVVWPRTAMAAHTTTALALP